MLVALLLSAVLQPPPVTLVPVAGFTASVGTAAGTYAGPVHALVFTPDGRYLAARNGHEVTLASREGTILRRLGLGAIAPGAGGSQLWLVRSDQAVLLDVSSVHVLERRRVPSPSDSRGEPSFRTYHGRGDWFLRQVVVLGDTLAVNVSRSRQVALWTTEGIELLAGSDQTGVEDHHWLARSPDRSSFVALQGERGPGFCWTMYVPPRVSGAIRMFTARGEPRFELLVQDNPATAVFSPDGHHLAVALHAGAFELSPENPSMYRRRADSPRLELRDAHTGALVAQRPAKPSVWWVGYLDADTLLALDGATLAVLDPRTLAPRQTIPLEGVAICAADLSAGGTHLALGRDTRVEVYRLAR